MMTAIAWQLNVMDPEQIVTTRFADIQAARAWTRTMPLINVEKLFNADELADLSRSENGRRQPEIPIMHCTVIGIAD